MFSLSDVGAEALLGPFAAVVLADLPLWPLAMMMVLEAKASTGLSSTWQGKVSSSDVWESGSAPNSTNYTLFTTQFWNTNWEKR